MLEEERRYLQLEASRHGTGLSSGYVFDGEGRYAFFSAVMGRDAGAHGFYFDKSKSRRNYPVYSKAINEDWQLCWAIEERREFADGFFVPSLEIRSRALRGTIAGAESGEFLLIRYAGIVPGFFNGYWRFTNLDELETVIKAHLHLYGLMASIIEAGLFKIIGRGSGGGSS